jgi:hypothetical protein
MRRRDLGPLFGLLACLLSGASVGWLGCWLVGRLREALR